MEILNKKERFSAFMLFLLMFAISAGVLVFALFFNYKLPLKENQVLKLENDRMIEQFNYQKKFSNEFKQINKLVDSLQKAPEKFAYIETTISSKLGNLQKEIPNDTLSANIYERVIVNIQELVTSKKMLLENNDSSTKIKELTAENKALQQKFEALVVQMQMAGGIKSSNSN